MGSGYSFEIIGKHTYEASKRCTPDWEFDKIFHSSEGGHIFYWMCNCGKEIRRSYSWDIKPAIAKERLFRAFTIHKLAHDIDDAARFNEVWDLCFPVGVKKKEPGIISKTVSATKDFGYFNLFMISYAMLGIIFFIIALCQ